MFNLNVSFQIRCRCCWCYDLFFHIRQAQFALKCTIFLVGICTDLFLKLKYSYSNTSIITSSSSAIITTNSSVQTSLLSRCFKPETVWSQARVSYSHAQLFFLLFKRFLLCCTHFHFCPAVLTRHSVSVSVLCSIESALKWIAPRGQTSCVAPHTSCSETIKPCCINNIIKH